MSLKPERKPRPAAREGRGTSSRPPRAPSAEVEIQLAIGKRGLGIELSRPATVGPLVVTELSLTLPTVRFPIDVSGGVKRFRHRHGTLERATVELRLKELVREWAPRAAGLVSRGAPELTVAPRRHGATVTLLDPEAERILAFDVAVLAEGGDLLLVPFDARGLSLPRPALELAVRSLLVLLRGAAERRGALLRIRGAYARVGRAILPEAGARAPNADGVKTAALTPANDAWVLQGFREAVEPEHAPEALRARELAEQVIDADDALVAGDHDRARVLYLHALSRLPRHPAVCARVADLDRLVRGREEAARVTLDDAELTPATALLSAELGERLAEANGDHAEACAAFQRAADVEPQPLVAAFALARASAHAPSGLDTAATLDAAVARVPHHAPLRDRRAHARLALGRLRDALADVEELEALSRGHRARHAVWMRAAQAWSDAGHPAEARALFERALRFAPDSPRALAGLGAAMLASGQRARGLQLLTRAFSFEGRTPPSAAHRLLLAEALADLGDRPTAVARLGEIVDAEDEAPVARGLEGRLRHQLGDLGGASLAYASLRDLVLGRPIPERLRARVAELLGEAVVFEDRVRRDPLLADSHRRALALAFPTALQTIPPAAPPPAPTGDDEATAEALIARYRENPDDHALVERLAGALSRLGRSHELLALLSARLEDAPAAIRAKLAPLHREVLAGLERDARARGHDHEAQLFREALIALGGTIEG